MKKIRFIAVILIVAAVAIIGGQPLFSLIFGQEEAPPTVQQPSDSVDKVYKIGFLQYSEQSVFDTVREAFSDRLDEWGYDIDRISVDYQSARGNMSKAENICDKFVSDGVDLIVAVSVPAAKAAVNAAQGTDVKVVYSDVSDPEGDLGNALNITGVGYASAYSEILDIALSADPELLNLGILYSAEESSSAKIAQGVKDYCAQKGITVTESIAAAGDDMAKLAEELCLASDAVFVPGDQLTMLYGSAIGDAARSVNTPWYTDTASMVEEGALAGVSADFGDMGRKTADMAVRLAEGADISAVPETFVDNYYICVNRISMDILQIAMPEETLTKARLY